MPDEAHREPLGAWLRAGYDARSGGALVVMCAVCATVGLCNYDLLDWSLGMDWLLVGIWGLMTAVLVWRVDPRRDMPLIIVGLIGGGVIEWWGTNTRLWVYFTQERPPLWILPAWPVAALTIDRLFRITDRALPGLRRLGPAWWLVGPAFVAVMTRFLWPTIHIRASQVVVGLMVLVTLVGARPRRDLVLFLVGATLGILLEYWGTTRYCWIYYTRAQPPLEAVLAHGFATVAFARAVQGLEWLSRVAAARAPGPAAPAGRPRVGWGALHRSRLGALLRAL